MKSGLWTQAGGMEQDREGQSQPAEVEENSSLSFTYDFFEVCSSSSAECVLGCILGFSESHTQKSPQEEKFRTIYQEIKWEILQMCCEMEATKCVGDKLAVLHATSGLRV